MGLRRLSLSTCAFAIATVLAVPASAQDIADTGTGQAPVQSANTIVVLAEIGFRNRTEDAEPTLIYNEQFFQRFEPLTAGDALKRVPSVTFLSDVLESDGARLRGLDPGYTQILINGERVPGAGTDRSFFLDRIPAELLERVEIIRSSSARRTGDAVAGSLNLVLRDGYSLEGGYVRGGGLLFDDGEFKPSGGIYYGGEVGPGRVLLGGNIQGRYNPKLKTSLRYGRSPENDPDFATEFDNREDQTDTRDGYDYAANFSYDIDGENTEFSLSANYVRTDRTEDERSFEYDDATAISGSVETGGNLLTDNANINEIDDESWAVAARLQQDWALGETTLRASFSRYNNQEDEVEYEIGFDDGEDDEDNPDFEPEFEGQRMLTDITDDELTFELDHEFEMSDSIALVVGGLLQFKDRASTITEAEQGDDLAASFHNWDQFSDNPLDVAGAFDPFADVPGGISDISEDRFDLFALVEGEMGAVKYEAGVRWESTSVRIEDFTVDAADAVSETDYGYFLPSASVQIALGDGRMTASAARTVRRANFNFISPALLEEELGDNDLLGNPQLRPETAWGGDLGYEHKIGRTGVVGVNLFYRSVTDLVEIADTGEVRDDDGDIFPILQPRNIGDGEVWGIEFDLSTSLGFIGLPDTGVFGNVSWLDSEISDFLGNRRFNDQSDYVFNVGLIQDVPSIGVALGATYREQGDAFGRVVGEEVTTSYGSTLEVFIEKRIGDSFTVRAVGSNLLDGTKDEIFNKFDTIEDQMDRDFDEYELESEEAGPVFQLIARYAF